MSVFLFLCCSIFTFPLINRFTASAEDISSQQTNVTIIEDLTPQPDSNYNADGSNSNPNTSDSNPQQSETSNAPASETNRN